MFSRFTAVLILFSAFILDISVSGMEPVSHTDVADKYGLFKAVFRSGYVAGDPDDPLNIDVRVTFLSPSGKRSLVPAFCLLNDEEKGFSLWETRFSPEEQGEYSFTASLSLSGEPSGEAPCRGTFRVNDTGLRGFLEKSPENPYYLRFSSGEPFFGIGHNVPWVNDSSPEIFARYFRLLNRSGCNLARIWICDWSLPLESGKTGNYDRVSSEKLDGMIESASENGIYIILCLDTYGSLMEEPGMWGEGKWHQNPYNIKNGGPCEKPEDLFTDPEAIRLYKNKLRYISARWGYSSNILSFELWNEYNSPPDWTEKMALYLKSEGRNEKLVTTSLGYPYGQVFEGSSIWRIPGIDIVTLHFYGNGDLSDLVNPLIQKSRELKIKYRKPFIVSEFGIDNAKDDRYYDERGEGKALHNSIWASVFSGSFGTAMNWWHDTYVRPKNLHRHYSALSRFLEGTDWDSKEVFEPFVSPVFRDKDKVPLSENRDAYIYPMDVWGVAGISEFKVMPNGDLSGGGMPLKYLHGNEKENMRVEQVYEVDYPKPGEFVIRVGTVSQGGHLEVFVDDEKVVDRIFPAGPGDGPWKKSRKLEEYQVYQCVYDEDVSFRVPEGKHRVRLSNSGKDWIGLEKISLKGYIPASAANARCLALNVGGVYMFWIQNLSSTWKAAFEGIKPEVIEGAYFEVTGVSDEEYTLEIWDTYSGERLSSKNIRPTGGKARIDLPGFSEDVACKLIRIKGDRLL